MGFEIWQIILGLVVAAAITLMSVGLGQPAIGVVVGLGLGWAAAIAPNYINTHHQDARDYFEGQIKRRVHHTLAINDKRVSEPNDWSERYLVTVAELPTPEDGERNGP